MRVVTKSAVRASREALAVGQQVLPLYSSRFPRHSSLGLGRADIRNEGRDMREGRSTGSQFVLAGNESRSVFRPALSTTTSGIENWRLSSRIRSALASRFHLML